MKNAVILVAGLGSRLKPLTHEVPKCLTEINGKPILKNTLELLSKKGFKRAVIVIGFLGERVREAIGKKFNEMDIIYLENPTFMETNSMYSAWLAREYIEKGTLLIEGDTIFEEEILERVLKTDKDKSFWIVDKFTEQFDGCMSTADENNRIIKVEIVKEKLKEYKNNFFKSTGILKITSEFGKEFSNWLNDDVKAGNVNIYYDLVLAKHIHEKPLYVYNISDLKWFEIDNFQDVRKAENIFQSTKYVMIIMDGSADLPLPELENKTPFEAAKIPNIDYLTENGRTGLLQTMYPGLPICSIVANTGLLGYNPARYYPIGRASFEALAQDIFLNPNDIAFRCNLISTENEKIKDFTAGMIDDESASKIINNLKIDDKNIEIYSGQSYRNLLIARNANFFASEIIAFEPHENISEEIKSKLLKHKGGIHPSIEKLNSIMLDSIEQIKLLNQQYNTKADMIWLWSPSITPRIPSFSRQYGVDGAIVAGMDFMNGLGRAMRMEVKKIPEATGDFDTNLKEKLKYAKNYLRYNDIVFIHINSPDEESHARNAEKKVKAIENIDREIIGPLLEFLNKTYPNNFRIAAMPDHYTFVKNGKHDERSVPYFICGKNIKKNDVKKFTEKEIFEDNKITLKSYDFINLLLNEGI